MPIQRILPLVQDDRRTKLLLHLRDGTSIENRAGLQGGHSDHHLISLVNAERMIDWSPGCGRRETGSGKRSHTGCGMDLKPALDPRSHIGVEHTQQHSRQIAFK
jgi:hypothetical protein